MTEIGTGRTDTRRVGQGARWRCAVVAGALLAVSTGVRAQNVSVAARDSVALVVNDASEAAAPSRLPFPVVVLDAGHGGADTGTHHHGIREKDVTLAVARRLRRLLEADGVRVVMTRDGDVAVPLRARGAMANAAGGDVFVSIHVNAMPGRARARGTETYVLGLHRSDEAEAVVARENASVRYESAPEAYDGYADALADERAALSVLEGSAHLRASERLAGAVEASMRRVAGRPSRGVRQAGFYVLYGAAMPALLVELGFVTDAAEAAFLASPSGQDRLARALHAALTR